MARHDLGPAGRVCCRDHLSQGRLLGRRPLERHRRWRSDPSGELVIVGRDGEDLVLVRQADHALLSGWLAAAWGAPPWQRLEPLKSTVVGARLHDLAWTPFDEELHCRPDGQPLAFIEVDRSTTTGFA